ncbi:hypothetical protein C8R45DRAFT_121569 [Mycena sanguinolenta]|nr:hypothetical protein C8R45DRAFT_121569 [Mycena sanguinolenta]
MDRIPVEVWLEVFSILQRSHLLVLHHVSHSFHRITRPLIFKHFHFHPYAGIDGHITGYYLLPDESEIRRTVRRLRFWASDEVAPLVKDCSVSPWDAWPIYTSCHNGDVLLTTFFDLLPRFTNLRKLSASYVKFKQPFLDAIVSLPNLKEIELGKCSVDQNITIGLPVKAERLTFLRLDNFLHKDELTGMQRWSAMVERSVLTNLSLLCVNAVTTFLDVDTVPLPNITTLNAYIHRDIGALHRFPGVRDLGIFMDVMAFPHGIASLFPLLEKYHGPPEFLPFIDSCAPLRRLQIDLCSALRVLQILQPCAQTLHSVTVLSLSFGSLPTHAFRPIMESFVSLLDFCLEIRLKRFTRHAPREMHTARSLFLELAEASPFPRGLRDMTIIWSAEASPDAEILLAARAAWATLKTAHPGLWQVHFAWPGARCRCRRPS